MKFTESRYIPFQNCCSDDPKGDASPVGRDFCILLRALHRKETGSGEFYFISARAATPGRVLPDKNWRKAPPPVEICVIFPANPNCVTSPTVDPPPITVVALRPERAVAIDLVPSENCGISNTPSGPFHATVRQILSSFTNSSMVRVRYLRS